MAYIKKTYAFKGEKMISFAGHIKADTAKKRGFDRVTLSIFDSSGKGRGQEKRFIGPGFHGMAGFN
jgi:hypothetical protein